MKFLVGVVGAVVILLMPLAHGSPIDSGSSGFWDNGEFDNIRPFLTLKTGDEPPIRSREAVSASVLEHSAGP